MSTSFDTSHPGPTDTPGQGRRHGHGLGSLLAIVLTAIPFWLVMSGAIANPAITALLIFAFAIVQIVVHVVFFLHLDTRSENGWTLLAFLFTVVIVVITISGSIWVMYHLNADMMPGAGPMR